MENTVARYKKLTYGDIANPEFIKALIKLKKLPISLTDNIFLKKLYNKIDKEAVIFNEMKNELIKKYGREVSPATGVSEAVYTIDKEVPKEKLESFNTEWIELLKYEVDSGLSAPIHLPQNESALTYDELALVAKFLDLPEEYYEV